MPETATADFLQLINAHAGILHKITRLYAENAEDKRDLRQEILYEAWRAYAAFRGEAAFSTWLYRVALNTALTFRRKSLRKVVTTEISAAQHLGEDLTEPLSAPAELLYQAIRRLPETDRAVITLQLDGYDNEDIADITGMSKNHIAVKLHRIKIALEKQLTDRNHE